MELISMTNFVIEQRKRILRKIDYKEKLGLYANIIYAYANFLKQPLELWMFVPCLFNGGHNVVMEEPTIYSNDEYDTIEVQLYNEAKNKCLFNGFKIEFSSNTTNILSCNGKKYAYSVNNKFQFYGNIKLIEELVGNEIWLTQTAIKKFEL